MANA
jgi:hypothetical protein